MTVDPNSSSGDAVPPGRSTVFEDDTDEFPYDFDVDFNVDLADFNDTDEMMTRYGSIDVQYRHAHRTISASMLAILTGVRIPVCQAFHHAAFGLLEDVGDYDGLVATPGVLIAGRTERLPAATAWLADHPLPDVRALEESSDVADIVDRHSLGLAMATNANPSLTIGSLVALQERLIGEVLDIQGECQVDEIDLLTETTLDLLGQMPASLRLVGGAIVRALPPLSV